MKYGTLQYTSLQYSTVQYSRVQDYALYCRSSSSTELVDSMPHASIPFLCKLSLFCSCNYSIWFKDWIALFPVHLRHFLLLCIIQRSSCLWSAKRIRYIQHFSLHFSLLNCVIYRLGWDGTLISLLVSLSVCLLPHHSVCSIVRGIVV